MLVSRAEAEAEEECSRRGDARSLWNPSGEWRVGETYVSASSIPVPAAVDSSARTKSGSTVARQAAMLNDGKKKATSRAAVSEESKMCIGIRNNCSKMISH